MRGSSVNYAFLLPFFCFRFYQLAKILSAADNVSLISELSCIEETKPASKADGAK